MENADVRRRVRQAIAEAKRRASDRRRRLDDASRAWDAARPRMVIPLARQLAQALTAEGIRLQVSTPSDRVLIASEHRPEERVELALEAGDDDAVLIARVYRSREGVVEERALARSAGGIEELTEERLLDALLAALEPWMAR
ncbi:MAG TPA: hypothetical protein VNK41_03245 [Vicinamibacterales bacterium]|nr:hypothetical protein [Vicinamibacterales bacterium]